MRNKRGYLILLFLFICVNMCFYVSAAENEKDQSDILQEEIKNKILGEVDFSEINQNLKLLFPDEKICFQDIVETLMQGNLQETGMKILSYVKDQISYEFRANKTNLVHILFIAITAAVFTNFSNALQNKQVGEISFYILYMLLITMSLNSFRIAVSGIEEKMENILEFMKVLCPGYLLSVVFAAGSSSALMFYNFILVLIYLVEIVVFRFLLPIINLYIMIQVMNYMLEEEVLSEFAELVKKGIQWSLKSLIGIVIGVNVVQGLLGPAMDTLKKSAWTKSLTAIPGIGNTFGSVTDVIFGTAVLIKNGIGMAGAIVIVGICLMPIIQTALLTFLYKLVAAMIQPISDSRITGCISSVSEGYELLLQIIITTMILFLITIAVVAAAAT